MNVFHFGPATSSDHSLTFFNVFIPLPHQLRLLLSCCSLSEVEIRSQLSEFRELQHGKFQKQKHPRLKNVVSWKSSFESSSFRVDSEVVACTCNAMPGKLINENDKEKDRKKKKRTQKGDDSPPANPSSLSLRFLSLLECFANLI
ncbi:hypothetical protein Pfo_019653 [Paulownia fortunei]|nr:hypothetical protein Pfo_019653 [Paulownia fortunei]